MDNRRKRANWLVVCFGFFVLLFFTSMPADAQGTVEKETIITSTTELADIPDYNGTAFVVVNNNVPDFYIWQIGKDEYVHFSPLDKLGRTGAGMACLSQKTMPTETRCEIGEVEPSGWKSVRYDDLIEDRYLYDRSHVIAHQLCGDNDTPEDLFTGTSYLNRESMFFFEDKVARYLESEPDAHVIYRVTPLYKDKDLVAAGVQMEAYSVEDAGKGLCFNVFVYNVQPGIEIDYKTGDSKEVSKAASLSIVSAAEAFAKTGASSDEKDYVITPDNHLVESTDKTLPKEEAVVEETPQPLEEVKEQAEQEVPQGATYILNKNTKKFHYPSCSSVEDMKEKNKLEFTGSRDEVINMGYVPCKRCKP